MLRQRRAATSVSIEDFEALVTHLERPLGLFLTQIVSSRPLAEDLLQETFLVAWRERARMPIAPDEQRAWLYGVARHQALHALRKRRRARNAQQSMESDGERGVQDAREPSDAVAMRDLLERELSPADRSLYVLRYVHGFSSQALAEMTGVRPATVRKRLERSSSRLRVALASQADRCTTSNTEDRNATIIAPN
jgi:RNA polymerase sigma-70 factor (ECF subfamily)